MYSVSVCLIISIYICVLSTDGRVLEVQKDIPVLKEISSIDHYWKDVMAFNKTNPLLRARYLESNFGPKLVSSALSNSLSTSKGMSDDIAKNGKPSVGSWGGLDFRKMPELGNSVGQTLTFSRRRGGGFGDFGSLGQDRYLTGGPSQSNAGESAGGAKGGGQGTGGSVHFRGHSAMPDEAVVGRGRGRGQGGGGGGAGVGQAAAGAAPGTGHSAEDGAQVQSTASSQAASASQSSNGQSQAIAASAANSQALNGNSTSVSNSQSMAAAHSDSDLVMANSQAMSASQSAADGQSSAAFSAAASSAASGQGLAASQAMSSAASFSAGNGQGFSGSQAMSASSSQSAAIGGINNNAFSSSASMSMASSNLQGAEAGNNEFKMNFNTPFGTTNVDGKIPIMRWKEQYSRWSRKKSHKKPLIQY